MTTYKKEKTPVRLPMMQITITIEREILNTIKAETAEKAVGIRETQANQRAITANTTTAAAI